jgi:hypothetical protein
MPTSRPRTVNTWAPTPPANDALSDPTYLVAGLFAVSFFALPLLVTSYRRAFGRGSQAEQRINAITRVDYTGPPPSPMRPTSRRKSKKLMISRANPFAGRRSQRVVTDNPLLSLGARSSVGSSKSGQTSGGGAERDKADVGAVGPTKTRPEKTMDTKWLPEDLEKYL